MDSEQNRTTEKRLAPRWEPAFLSALREVGVVRAACDAAGIGRTVAYDRRNADPEFAAAWDEALEDSADLLEIEAVRRAKGHVHEPVIYQGQLCGIWVDAAGKRLPDEGEKAADARFIPLTIPRYSDTMLIFVLKGLRPEKYRESAAKVDVNVNNHPPLVVGGEASPDTLCGEKSKETP